MGDAEDKGYRAASETLDERPSAAARAAILAAAARHVGAKPQSAEAPLARPRGARTTRWPLAAAATVLLSSTLAVLLATRTEHELPSFTPPAPAPQSQVAGADAGRSAAAPPDAAAPSPTAPAASPPIEPATPTVEAKRRAPGAAGSRLAERSERDTRGAGPSSAMPERPMVGAAPVAPTTDPPRAKQEAAEPRANEFAAPPSPAASTAGGLLKRTTPAAKPDATTPAALERQRDERTDAANAPSTLRAPASPAAIGAASRDSADGARETELSAEQWLQKIIALRAAGRDDEADAELRRFRERHPQVQVPRAALPASGTR